jgi:DNA topoisomerase-1
MRLIIVESPAKCSKIQGFLGPGNKVIASMGHIRALAHDLDAVGINKNFEPTYEFMKEKAKAIAMLKDAAKGATSIVLCSDDDREGEAIAYSLAVLLKLNPLTNPRAAFREITQNAVLDALVKPRTIDMNKVNSQQARAMLDMMVGFTISPLLWKHIGGMAALSAGRCQTPALRMVCDVEAVIDSFKSESSWALTGTFTSAATSAATLVAKWPAAMIDSLSDEESALNYLENHHAEPGAVVKSNTVKPWTESPPQPLMTSTLQQQASNLYHCSPKRTMQIAQKLYEAGHITYMRTDQTTMSKEAVEDARKMVESKWGKTYLGPMVNNTKAKKAEVQAQEAHEAIRPTHFEYSKLPDGEDWGIQDHKIYRLIWLRSIQSTMAPAKGDACEVILELDGDEDLPWLAKWRRTIFPGWKAADEKETDTKKAENGDQEDLDHSTELSGEDAWKMSESLKAGTKVKWTSLTATPKESKPRGRYTEATLVRDLEKKGIGRPSTFASLISTIVEKTYVEVQDIPAQTQKSKTFSLSSLSQWPPKKEEFLLKKGGEKARMVPTPLGKTVLEFTLKHFPDLFAYDFTAGMERRLDKVAEGTEQWKAVLQDTWDSYKDRISELKSSSTGGGGAGGTVKNNKSRDFGNGLKAVLTAKGPLLLKEGATKEETVFYGWPSTVPKKGLHEITEEEVKAFIASVTSQKQGDSMGEWNGHQIYKKKGPYGFYAEWNGTRVNLAEADDVDAVIAKINAKQENPTRTLGPFQIKTGPYGPYLMKVGAAANSAAKGASKAKPQYVSIPKETNIEEMTAQQAGEIFEAGLKAKAAGAGGKKRFYKK